MNITDTEKVNTGVIVGIAVGVLVSIGFCVLNIIMVIRKKKCNNNQTKNSNKGIECTILS